MFTVYRGIEKDAKLLIFQSVFPSMAYGLFYTDISFFLTSVQGLPYEFMGLIITLMGISTFLASIPIGLLADRFGRKKTLIVGNVVSGIILVFFAFTKNPLILIIAAIVEGVSEAAFSASSGAWLAEKAHCEKRNSVFCLSGFASSLAFGLGSIAIPIVLIFRLFGFSDSISHGLLYALFAAMCLLSTILLVKVPESYKRSNSKPFSNFSKKEDKKNSLKIIAKYVISSSIIAIGAGLVVPLMTSWFKLQYGIPDVISGPLLGVVSIVIAIATLAGPPLAKRFGLVRSIVLTQAASTIFMFLTPLSANYLIAGFVYSIRAFLMNMASPLSQSMIMGLVNENDRGMASGINTALWRLPNALSTYIGAYLMSLGFLAVPFYLAGILYAVSIGSFYGFFKKTRLPEE
jgi:MFS family permease